MVFRSSTNKIANFYIAHSFFTIFAYYILAYLKENIFDNDMTVFNGSSEILFSWSSKFKFEMGNCSQICYCYNFICTILPTLID